MNVRHLVPSVSRWLLSMGSLMLLAGLQQPVHASDVDLSKFRILTEPQYIAALGDAGATSGNGGQSWGLWSQDPGPRGCKLDRYDQLKAGGVTRRRHSGNSTLPTGGSRSTARSWRSRPFHYLLGNTSSRETAR